MICRVISTRSGLTTSGRQLLFLRNTKPSTTNRKQSSNRIPRYPERKWSCLQSCVYKPVTMYRLSSVAKARMLSGSSLIQWLIEWVNLDYFKDEKLCTAYVGMQNDLILITIISISLYIF